MRYYEFWVYDSDEDGSLWGQLRFKARTEKEARKACRQQLLDEEVEPNGLIVPPFRLVLLK